jgi:hypothetical protein
MRLRKVAAPPVKLHQSYVHEGGVPGATAYQAGASVAPPKH